MTKQMKTALPLLLCIPLLAACSSAPAPHPVVPHVKWSSHPCRTPNQPTHREMTNELFKSLGDLQGVYCYDASDSSLDPPTMGSSIVSIQPAFSSDDWRDGLHVWYDVFFVGGSVDCFSGADGVGHYHMHRSADVLQDATGEEKLHICYKNGKVDGFYMLDPDGAGGGTWFYYSKQPLRHRYGVADGSLIATPPPLPKNN